MLLREAGWDPQAPNVREYEVRGMPNPQGVGYVDYVLWGDDGLPLAVVEAKRTKRSPAEGQRQAELYADCLETMTGRRPVIYYTNGYETWLWDDTWYPPREVQGFANKDELQLMVNRRAARRDITRASFNRDIASYYYQEEAIRRVMERFQTERARGAAGDGDRHRQDARQRRHCRHADARRLGTPHAVSGRPHRAGQSGQKRLQCPSAACLPGQPGDRKRRVVMSM